MSVFNYIMMGKLAFYLFSQRGHTPLKMDYAKGEYVSQQLPKSVDWGELFF